MLPVKRVHSLRACYSARCRKSAMSRIAAGTVPSSTKYASEQLPDRSGAATAIGTIRQPGQYCAAQHWQVGHDGRLCC